MCEPAWRSSLDRSLIFHYSGLFSRGSASPRPRPPYLHVYHATEICTYPAHSESSPDDLPVYPQSNALFFLSLPVSFKSIDCIMPCFSRGGTDIMLMTSGKSRVFCLQSVKANLCSTKGARLTISRLECNCSTPVESLPGHSFFYPTTSKCSKHGFSIFGYLKETRARTIFERLLGYSPGTEVSSEESEDRNQRL